MPAAVDLPSGSFPLSVVRDGVVREMQSYLFVTNDRGPRRPTTSLSLPMARAWHSGRFLRVLALAQTL